MGKLFLKKSYSFSLLLPYPLLSHPTPPPQQRKLIVVNVQRQCSINATIGINFLSGYNEKPQSYTSVFIDKVKD